MRWFWKHRYSLLAICLATARILIVIEPFSHSLSDSIWAFALVSAAPVLSGAVAMYVEGPRLLPSVALGFAFMSALFGPT